MTENKKEEKAIDLRDKITLYAPKDAKHHSEGEEIKIHPVQKEKFLKHGFTENPSKTK